MRCLLLLCLLLHSIAAVENEGIEKKNKINQPHNQTSNASPPADQPAVPYASSNSLIHMHPQILPLKVYPSMVFLIGFLQFFHLLIIGNKLDEEATAIGGSHSNGPDLGTGRREK